MRTLGLLGGMSWESTLPYYRLLNERVRERMGGLHSAKLLLYSVDFAEIEALQHRGEWDAAGEVLADAAARLQQAGAQALVICTNTMHKVAAQVEAATDVPLLHIADATARRIHAAGLHSRRPARHSLHHGAGVLSRASRAQRPAGTSCPARRRASASTPSFTTNCVAA